MARKQKLLIANRGEIAIRIARTCRDLGIATVAVYSDADRDALHVEMADESFRIGPPLASSSYLAIDRVMEVAIKSKATLVHPGYGFLAERPAFAQAVEDAGLAFVGPPSQVIETMGDKAAARRVADAAGMPIVPGTRDPVDLAQAKKEAARIGFPLLVKAAFGGGGKGMHVVRDADHLEESLKRAAREAKSYFGRPEVFLERYVDRAHHVEAQIMADAHGNVFFLGERDCSVQRRHQKLIEETPSPLFDDRIRERFAEATTSLAKESGYVNAGTIECVMDEDGDFYFLEMNTRLQVEHTVTEMVTGLDLVGLQIRVALGEKLALDPAPRGASIQCRINAEDPGRNFLPGPGRVTRYREPAGPFVRVDSGIEQGREIPGDYDSMFAKLDRIRAGPRHGPDPDAPSARRVPGGGRAHHDLGAPVDPGVQGVPSRQAHDHVAGTRPRRRGAAGAPGSRLVRRDPQPARGHPGRSGRPPCPGPDLRRAARTRPPTRRCPPTRTTASTCTARSSPRCRARS